MVVGGYPYNCRNNITKMWYTYVLTRSCVKMALSFAVVRLQLPHVNLYTKWDCNSLGITSLKHNNKTFFIVIAWRFFSCNELRIFTMWDVRNNKLKINVSVDSLFSLCGAESKGDWVQCTRCPQWYHCKCVSITVAEADNSDTFRCPWTFINFLFWDSSIY